MTIATVLSVVLAAAVAAAASFPKDFDAALREAKEVEVATRRKNGDWSTFAPIWFYYDGKAVYFTTTPGSNKGKRIAAGSDVLLRVRGKTAEGKTEIIRDPAVVDKMGEAYDAKYWIAWFGLFRPRGDRVVQGKTMAVKVTPAGRT